MKIYLATVCFLPVIYLVWMIYIFLGSSGPVADWFVTAHIFTALYLWIGLVVVIVDLWKQKINQDRKVIWTVLILVMAIPVLPVYWFFRAFKFGK